MILKFVRKDGNKYIFVESTALERLSQNPIIKRIYSLFTNEEIDDDIILIKVPELGELKKEKNTGYKYIKK